MLGVIKASAHNNSWIVISEHHDPFRLGTSSGPASTSFTFLTAGCAVALGLIQCSKGNYNLEYVVCWLQLSLESQQAKGDACPSKNVRRLLKALLKILEILFFISDPR